VERLGLSERCHERLLGTCIAILWDIWLTNIQVTVAREIPAYAGYAMSLYLQLLY